MNLAQRGEGTRRRWTARLVLAVAVLTVTAVPAPTVAASAAAPSAVSASLYEPLTSQFHDYGDAAQGWTGGDSTYSVLLPDGRTVWVFSDTFLGSVAADHSRNLFTPLIHNSFVVQDGSTFTTRHGGTPSQPAALVEPEHAAGPTFYWMGDGTVVGDKLHVFVHRYVIVPPFLFVQTANDVATFSLPSLTLEGVRPSQGAYLPSKNSEQPIRWGVAVLEDGEHTYVYGTDEPPLNKHLHVARARPEHLVDGPWEYWTGSGWSPDPLDAVRVLSEVAGELSVVKADGGYRLVTQHVGIGDDILAYWAPTPAGPWRERTVLYTTPERLASGGRWFTYNAHEHPQLGGPGKVVLTYNVNSFEAGEIYRDVHVYRPRFVEIGVTQPSTEAAPAAALSAPAARR